MRRSSLAFALLATTALAAPAFAADAAMKSPWDGLGEGSWVLQKTVTTNENGGKKEESVTESKYTLKKITDKAYTLKIETKVGADWIPMDLDLPRVAEASTEKAPEVKTEDLGKETLTIDGEEIECKKQKSTVGTSVTLTWSDDKLGVLKSETKGTEGESTTETTKLKDTIKIKDKDVECRVEKTTMKSPQMEMTATMWRTDAGIPSQTGYVRSESTMKITGMGTTTDVMETVDFEKK